MGRNYILLHVLNASGTSYDYYDSRRDLPNIIIESLGERVKPQQEAERISIAGRNGAIYIRQGYLDSTRTIRVGLLPNGSIDDVVKFFNNEGRIIFSDDPNYYYEFLQLGQITFNKVGIFKEAEIELILRPFHFELDREIVSYDYLCDVRNLGTVYSTPLIQFLPSQHPSDAEYWELQGFKSVSSIDSDNPDASIIFRVDSIPTEISYVYADTETGNVFYMANNQKVFVPRQINKLSNFWLPATGVYSFYSLCSTNSRHTYSYTSVWVIDKVSRFL